MKELGIMLSKKPQQSYSFKKRHGSTTFLVNVHSSKTNTETANDKISRLIRNDKTLRKVSKLGILN